MRLSEKEVPCCFQLKTTNKKEPQRSRSRTFQTHFLKRSGKKEDWQCLIHLQAHLGDRSFFKSLADCEDIGQDSKESQKKTLAILLSRYYSNSPVLWIHDLEFKFCQGKRAWQYLRLFVKMWEGSNSGSKDYVQGLKTAP